MDNRFTGNKNYSVEKIWDHHHEIVRRLALGQRPRQIALDLDVSVQTISNVRNSPLVKQQLAMLHAVRDVETTEVARQILEVAPKAIRVIEDMLDDEEQKADVRLRAALGTLDHAIPRRSVQLNVDQHLNEDDMNDIKKIALERGKKSGVISDNAEEVEFTEVAPQAQGGEDG